MKVNFNNLRKQALFSYDRLARKLNKNLKESIVQGTDPGRFYYLKADDIQQSMSDLRMYLCSIACVYEEGDSEFADLSDICDTIAVFNEEKEENI